jgi:hypothetical protein
MIHSTQAVGVLKDKGETDAKLALKRFDVGKLNEVKALFTRFIKSVEGNSISYSNTLFMLQKPLV